MVRAIVRLGTWFWAVWSRPTGATMGWQATTKTERERLDDDDDEERRADTRLAYFFSPFSAPKRPRPSTRADEHGRTRPSAAAFEWLRAPGRPQRAARNNEGSKRRREVAKWRWRRRRPRRGHLISPRPARRLLPSTAYTHTHKQTLHPFPTTTHQQKWPPRQVNARRRAFLKRRQGQPPSVAGHREEFEEGVLLTPRPNSAAQCAPRPRRSLGTAEGRLAHRARTCAARDLGPNRAPAGRGERALKINNRESSLATNNELVRAPTAFAPRSTRPRAPRSRASVGDEQPIRFAAAADGIMATDDPNAARAERLSLPFALLLARAVCSFSSCSPLAPRPPDPQYPPPPPPPAGCQEGRQGQEARRQEGASFFRLVGVERAGPSFLFFFARRGAAALWRSTTAAAFPLSARAALPLSPPARPTLGSKSGGGRRLRVGRGDDAGGRQGRAGRGMRERGGERERPLDGSKRVRRGAGSLPLLSRAPPSLSPSSRSLPTPLRPGADASPYFFSRARTNHRANSPSRSLNPSPPRDTNPPPQTPQPAAKKAAPKPKAVKAKKPAAKKPAAKKVRSL
jgi:hypothetical protein